MQRRFTALQKNQTSSKLADKTQEISIKRKGLPSIPDWRNKYGIDSDTNIEGYIHKSQEDLHREKQIMKCYRSMLREGLPSLKQNKMKQNPSEQQKQIIKILKSLQLQSSDQNQVKMKKLSPKKMRINKAGISKLKSNKLLNTRYQSIQLCRLHYNQEIDKKQQKTQKFQFFGSSELRFKDLSLLQNKEQVRKSVGEYLKLMKREKQKQEEKPNKISSKIH